MQHQSFLVEAEAEEGIAAALAWAELELGLIAGKNPDVIVLRHGLFSVEDARKVNELAHSSALIGSRKAIIIAASRLYAEAQNSLLKVLEDQPQGVYIFIVLPTLGGILPTITSRTQELSVGGKKKAYMSEAAEAFIKADSEKRLALVKRLAAGRDEDARRENRDEAIGILDGVEAAAYAKWKEAKSPEIATLLADIAKLRGSLHDRAASVRMILEHLALVLPKRLL